MTPATTISGVVTDIGSVLTGVTSWVPDIFTMITSNALFLTLILLPVVMAIVFAGIGLIKSVRGRKRV